MLSEESFYQFVLDCKSDRTVFVETGTAVGNTSIWASNFFDSVITVEYMEDLYRSCIERFWNINNIKLIHGDSSQWIDLIVHNVNEDAVWFLDAHNVNREDGLKPPSETPVVDEIVAIFKAAYNHIVIIDDLRLFGSEAGYPYLNEVRDLGNRYRFNIEVYEEKDFFVARRI